MDEVSLDILRGCARFYDVYILTQGGSIRRTCVPAQFFGFTAYLHVHQGDLRPAFYDELICNVVNRDNCTYAEALVEVLHYAYSDDDTYERFLGTMGPPAGMTRVLETFRKQQSEREKLWREAHNEWREDLPPALD